jgi:hypothetical protein
MRVFAATHADFIVALTLISKRTVFSGSTDDTFISLSTFRFVNTIGVS